MYSFWFNEANCFFFPFWSSMRAVPIRKRDLIMREHPNIRHVFEDVLIFKDMKGQCVKTGLTVNLNDPEFETDIFICGPSCKGLSKLNASRASDFGCYEREEEDQSGTSGPTYHYGFKLVS